MTTQPDFFSTLSYEQRRIMLNAGAEVRECHRVLSKAGLNPVGEILRGQGNFYQYNHYPKGDIYDRETHAQYYYHAHRGLEGENGHFHTFLRPGGIPQALRPVERMTPDRVTTRPAQANDEPAHVIAVSMDRYGWPIGLFTTNRWVTNQTWYTAADTIELLDRFCIDHAYPSWPVNRWITALFRLFRPQMITLLYQRDQTVRDWAIRYPERDVFEDRELEVTSSIRIDTEHQITELQAVSAQDSPPRLTIAQ